MTSAASSFADLGLPPAVLANLRQLGYLQMTPIQAASLPLALAGHDLIAQASTGSGKTAAFALPLLGRIRQRWFAVQAMVLCPTRELADQVAQEIRRLARFTDNLKVVTLCGGTPMLPQRLSLEHGAHVVVGTPGRIVDHLERGSLNLDGLSTLVLDEADRMLDMGFYEAMAWIARQCPLERQTLLFSATYPEEIVRLAADFLYQPQEVRLPEAPSASRIAQRCYPVEREARLAAVATLLQHYRPQSALAFCNTKQRCNELVASLRAQGISALALHGDLEQRERDLVLIRFANRSCTVLVATDVAARGLDIPDLELVINVEVTPDPEVHVHRIGRTGRAGQSGLALTLVATDGEKRRLGEIVKQTGSEPEWGDLSALTADPAPLLPPMATLEILGGRKEKIRPGDVLGALTGDAGFTREQVGKINVSEQTTYVAVASDIADEAVRRLSAGRLKGRPVRLRVLTD